MSKRAVEVRAIECHLEIISQLSVESVRLGLMFRVLSARMPPLVIKGLPGGDLWVLFSVCIKQIGQI